MSIRWRQFLPWLMAGVVSWSCASKDDGMASPDGSPTGGQDGATPGATSDSGGVVPPAPSDWCSARAVLSLRCVSCHVPGSIYGSISLVTFADLQTKLPSGQTAYQAVKERIHDPTNPMPPTIDRLTPTELATLDNWIASGATAGPNPSCVPGSAGDAGDGGGGTSGAGGSGGAAGAGGGGGGAGGAAGSGGVADGGVDASDGSVSGDAGASDGRTDVDASDGSGSRDTGASDRRIDVDARGG